MIIARILSTGFATCAFLVLSFGDAQAQDCRKEDKFEQIEACTAQITTGGDDVRIGTGYLYRCQAFDILDRYERALEDCKKALDYMPRDSSIFNSLAIIYQNQGDYASAVQASTQAITLKDDVGGYWNTRANNYCKAKRYDKSVDDRLTALEKGAYSPEVLQRVLSRAGFYSGTIDGKIGSGTISALRAWTRAGC